MSYNPANNDSFDTDDLGDSDGVEDLLVGLQSPPSGPTTFGSNTNNAAPTASNTSSYKPGSYGGGYTPGAYSTSNNNTGAGANINTTGAGYSGFGAYRPGQALGGKVEVIQGPGSDDSSSTSESESEPEQPRTQAGNTNNATSDAVQAFIAADSSSDEEVTSNFTNNFNINRVGAGGTASGVTQTQPTYPRATSSQNKGSPPTQPVSTQGNYGAKTNLLHPEDDRRSPQFGAPSDGSPVMLGGNDGHSGGFSQEAGGDLASQAAKRGQAIMNRLAQEIERTAGDTDEDDEQPTTSYTFQENGANREPSFGGEGLGGAPAHQGDASSPGVHQMTQQWEQKFAEMGIAPAQLNIDGASPAQTVLMLRQALSSYQALLDDSEKTVNRLQDARLEQDKQVRTAQRKAARLEQDTAEAVTVAEDSRREAEMWKAKHAKLAETYMEAEVSKCELTNLKEDVERLTRECDLAKEAEEEWKKRAELAEGRMKTLEVDVKQLAISNKAIREEHALARTELEQRQSDAARVAQQMNANNQTTQDLQAQLDAYRASSRRSPQPMQGGRLASTPSRGAGITPNPRGTNYDEDVQKKLRLVQQTGDEWRTALERKTRECEYWMNRANKKVLGTPAGTPVLPKDAFVLGDQDLDNGWGMSPTRDPVKPAQVSERTDLNRERLKNSYMSPATPKRRPKDIENVLDGALGLAHNKAQQVFGSTPQTPAMPQPKRSNPAAPSPPHAGIADMLDMAEQAEICDIHDPQSLINALLSAVNLELTVEENTKDGVEDPTVPKKLQDVENAIEEFLFLSGGDIDQERAQDRLEVELTRQPPKVIRRLNSRFKDMKNTLRGKTA